MITYIKRLAISTPLFALIIAVSAMALLVTTGAAGEPTPVTASKPAARVLDGGPDVAGLPRVLLLGDSISLGYHAFVRTSLAGIANVYRPAENCSSSAYGLGRLDAWLSGAHWDVIHFNFGLHDLKYLDEKGNYVPPDKGKQVAPPELYRKQLTEFARRLKATGAKLIFATTTPVPEGSGGRVFGAEKIYNAVARESMVEQGVSLDDLCALVVEKQKTNPGIQLPHNVHFTKEGSELLSKAVVESIKKQLPLSNPSAAAMAADPVPMRNIQIEGFWKDQFKRQTLLWIPHCIQQLDVGGNSHEMENLVHAGQLLRGEPVQVAYKGPPWVDAYTYNTIEAICLALEVDSGTDAEWRAGQEMLRAKMEQWIPIILAAQEPCGYIDSPLELQKLPHFSVVGNHEFYVMGYFIEMGVAHYRMTGGKDRRLYDAAIRCADHLDSVFGPSPKRTWTNGHPGLELALCRLGESVNLSEGPGKGEKYIALAQYFIEHQNSAEHNVYNQSEQPAADMREARGHAVRATYFYSGMAATARLKNNQPIATALDAIWSNAIDKKEYLTGGVGASHNGEAFAGDYLMPNDGYCEACAGCGMGFWATQMYRRLGTTRFIDVQERLMYNNLLGAVALDGKSFYYQNPLESNKARHPWHACPCCVGNLPRSLIAIKDLIYAVNSTRDTLYVNHFVASKGSIARLAKTDLNIQQQTRYPWDGSVVITLMPGAPAAFTLALRIPNRTESKLYTAQPEAAHFSITVNGEPCAAEKKGGYALVTRTWKPGDRVELTLAMDIQRITCDERVAANKGRVAFQRGPIVYNFEDVDQPGTAGQMTLHPNSKFAPVWNDTLLGGVMTLKGDGLTAIPNYVRLNRGGASRVWLPLDHVTPGNRPERLEWFRDQGFGLFIHWSVDSQIGTVISHSMVGASDDYVKRFVEELPKTFSPRKFHPEDWAALARLAGIKYVVFTTKHHSGFCMFDTPTTDFNIMHTPFKRDIAAEIFTAFRDQGIAAGVYFSPDDFWWLYKHGITIQRGNDEVQPRSNPGLMSFDQQQVRELMTKYGPIDVIFFDGEAESLREVAWQAQPNVVVTRGAIQTPEQYVPGIPLDGAWEANLTMGKAWQYQPTLENYKSASQCVSLLVEVRAKGGNLLLNVGPKPDGELPIEQEERLREIALWMFVNHECIEAVRPWVITNEHETWFTRKKNEDTLYAIVKSKERWPDGVWKEITLKSVRGCDQTQVSVLGQNDRLLEYRKDVAPKTTWKQEADGLHVRVMHTQRMRDDRTWPNPIVIKLTHVKPALTPPLVETVSVSKGAACKGFLRSLGDAESVEVGFEYRDITGLDTNERPDAWTATTLNLKKAPGEFSAQVAGLQSGRTYEIRAVVKHPLLPLYGKEIKIALP